ncbi:MAG: redoxin domain-containing protein [Armatimonadota bacterium]|nr:redoxin domain-containing protein [Armatimonadota bacterium]
MIRRLEDKLIIGLIVFLLIANFWMLGRNLGLSFSPQPKSFLEAVMEETWKKHLKEDPPLGTEISELKPFKGKRVVIVIERCTDCVAQSLRAWSEAIKREGLPKLVLVTGDSEEQAKQVIEKWKIDAEIVSDKKGKIAKKLHAFFTPRAYAFENGRLIWKQEELGLKPLEMIREVMRR